MTILCNNSTVFLYICIILTDFKASPTHDNQFRLQGFEVYDVKGTDKDSKGYQKHWWADSEEKKREWKDLPIHFYLVNNSEFKYN